MEPADANIDLEEATGTSGEPPNSPNSRSTWESQNETLSSPIVEQPIVIEEDTDEESGKFQSIGLKNRHLD